MKEINFIDSSNSTPLIEFASTKPKFKCKKHGETHFFIQAKFKEIEGYWCQICAIEKLDELGVNRLEINDNEEEKNNATKTSLSNNN